MAANASIFGLPMSALAYLPASANAWNDSYLRNILAREAVDVSIFAPARSTLNTLDASIRFWANGYLSSIAPSGSFAKGTANRSGTDLDIFISLRSDAPGTLKEAFRTLKNRMVASGFIVREQNVSLGITVNGWAVDLIPARAQHPFSSVHSLYHKRSDSWRKTDVRHHINHVRASNRLNEIRLLKLWRDQHQLEFPSFYLELATIRALQHIWFGSLSQNILTVLRYLSTAFASQSFVDPANSANIISDDLTIVEKAAIKKQAMNSLQRPWGAIVR